jgi:hypothetical protein
VTALGKTIFLKPDFVLYYKDTKIIIALIGVKKSWRERYKIDDRDCILLKIAYPDLVWIDMTHKENTNTTIEKEKDMIKKVELDSFFDFICSTYVVESQEAMFDALENHLRSLLPTNK